MEVGVEGAVARASRHPALRAFVPVSVEDGARHALEEEAAQLRGSASSSSESE